MCFSLRLALEKCQDALLRLVGLGQHAGGGLRQDLVLRQVAGFSSEVRILNLALGGSGVGADVAQIVDGVIQTVDRGGCAIDFFAFSRQLILFCAGLKLL